MSKSKARGSAKLARAVDPATPPIRARAADVLGYFDRAYVINRDRDAGRLAKMSVRLRRLGLAFERFAAVEAKADERLFPDKPQLTPGYFGCARSHLSLLRTARERGEQRVIVLEDDAVLRDDTMERMARIVPRLRGIEWDVFYFGLQLLEASGRISKELGIVKRSFHAHAYAVSGPAIPAIIEIIESAMREGFHFDCHEMAGKPPLLRVYADPILAVQEPDVSGVLGHNVSRLGQYFPPFDQGEFFAHCAEARGWEGKRAVNGREGGAAVRDERGCGTDKPAQHLSTPDDVKMATTERGANPDAAPQSNALATPERRGAGVQATPDIAAPSPSQGAEGRHNVEKPLNSSQFSLLREAKRHHKVNRLAEAERVYRLVLEQNPEEAEALHLLGMLEHQRGRTASAVELLFQAAAFRPDDAEFRGKLGMALAAAGRNDEALEALDSAIERNGGSAEAHHNRGVVLDRLGRGDEAVTAWKRAIELRPGYDDALTLLGQKLLARNQAKEALVPLGEAVAANLRNASAHNNLGIALRKTGELAKAASHFRRAAVLRPGHAEAHSNLGTALNELGQPAEAVPHLEKACELRSDFVDAHWNLALSLLSLGEFDRGWLEYEWRRRLPADVAQQRQQPLPQPEWNGCNIAGRTVLVACEQGLGDTLQFIRYVPLLARRGAKVIVECQPPLRELLSTLEGAAVVVARGEPLPRFDLHVRLLSLPGMLGMRLGNVPAEGPYLRSDQVRAAEWRCRLSVDLERPRRDGASNLHPEQTREPATSGSDEDCDEAAALVSANNCAERVGVDHSERKGGAESAPSAISPQQRRFRIGIAWQGNPTFPNDRERSIPLLSFAPLAAVTGVRLYSLQKNQGVEQLAEARKRFPIVDFSPPLDEGCGAFVDTAAVMANLDLVVSSDTSMVHLAGALGVRVWMAANHACDWRWMRNRDDSPWYPTLRLFRQPRPGDWSAVFQRMAAALRDTLASPDGRPAEHPPVAVPMAPGDLIDRLTILQIKSERLSDPLKLRGIRAELDALRAARQRSLPNSEQLETLTRELREVNEQLWAIEDDIRLCERSGDFGPKFVELARSVYRTNDRRADLKRRINTMLGSALGDEKQYQAYD
jgi:tetratricopeptide (TPR) repeat protein